MLINIIMYLIFSVCGLILIKNGSQNVSFNILGGNIDISVNIQIIIGLIFYIISFILWVIILKNEELSYIFPVITGLSYILIMISSIYFLGERINIYKVVGSITILLGLILINLKK